MSWRGVCTATPQQADPTSNPGLRANRARPPHGQDYHGPLRAESCTACTTAPRRFGWLGMASSPMKLREIRRPHEPKPFGPAPKHLYLLRGHAGDGTDCISPRPIAYAASDGEGAELVILRTCVVGPVGVLTRMGARRPFVATSRRLRGSGADLPPREQDNSFIGGVTSRRGGRPQGASRPSAEGAGRP